MGCCYVGENLFTITEEEYQRYVFEDELFKIIVETEAALHNIEDPVEIAVGVMKAACKFYGADWCGILIADLRSQFVIRQIKRCALRQIIRRGFGA